MSMFTNSVDKILKGAHLIIADLDQHAKNMLRDVAVHSETIAQATEKKLKASAEHQRALLLAERFKSLIGAASVVPPGTGASGVGQSKPSGVLGQASNVQAKKPM